MSDKTGIEWTDATAAARVGMTVTEYRDRVNAGLLHCWRCQDWHPADEFSVDRSRGRGRAGSCRRSTNAAARKRYQRKQRPTPGRRYTAARDGDYRQARRRVNHLVDIGALPRPNAVPCTDCGHVWSPGERRHEYDHHLGYAPEHHEDVQAVCTTCHHAREDTRRAA
jgi:hypothetical protein